MHPACAPARRGAAAHRAEHISRPNAAVMAGHGHSHGGGGHAVVKTHHHAHGHGPFGKLLLWIHHATPGGLSLGLIGA